MTFLKTTEIKLEGVVQAQAESNIRKHTSHRPVLLWMAATSDWVINKERRFVGKETKSGRVSVARYRYPIFKFFPKIYTHWSLTTIGNDLLLEMRHKPSILTTLGYWFLPALILVVGLINGGEDAWAMITTLVWMIAGFILFYVETTLNEKLLAKLAQISPATT
jgi:hypothetical protein